MLTLSNNFLQSCRKGHEFPLYVFRHIPYSISRESDIQILQEPM